MSFKSDSNIEVAPFPHIQPSPLWNNLIQSSSITLITVNYFLTNKTNSQVDEADLEAELAMLSDELGELDTGGSYLDDALNAPGVPTAEPHKPTAARVSD